MPEQHHPDVQRLLDRQAISDCVHRYSRGLDRHDDAMVASCYWDDAIDEHGPFTGSPDEFIAWALEQPTGRFELSNGTVVAMAPERASHNQAKLNAAVALRAAIGARGLPCRVMTDGMAVRIDDRTVYEPDAAIFATWSSPCLPALRA